MANTKAAPKSGARSMAKTKTTAAAKKTKAKPAAKTKAAGRGR